MRLTLDREKAARESAASDNRAKELEKMREQERERLEREDSLAELEVLRHVEELQRDAEGRSATSPASSAVSEDDFF